MSFTISDGYEVYLDSICECIHCPPNTKQCAHLDGHWVRLTDQDGVPAIVWNFAFPEWKMNTPCVMFYHPPSSLPDLDMLPAAEENFHKLNEEMRKIASGVPGDVCT